MTLMQRAAGWLGQKVNDAAGVPVIIRTGGHVSGQITASCTMHNYEVLDGSGFMTTVLSYDWLFVTEELLIGGGAFELRPGDTITATIRGMQEVYEVIDLGRRKRVEWFDTSGELTVVHTQKVT